MKRATDLLSRLGLAVAPRLAPTELEGDVARLVPREYADLVGLDAYADAMGELKSLSEKHGFPVVMVARGGGAGRCGRFAHGWASPSSRRQPG